MHGMVCLLTNRKIKTGKLINELPVMSKDKAGANAWILALQMINLLKDRTIEKENKFSQKSEQLEQYYIKYLKGGIRIFCKMLCQVEKGHFNKTSTLFRTKTLEKKLKTPSRDLEIIPLKELWRYVFEQLD